MTENVGQESWNYSERRSRERSKVTLKRTFSSEIRAGSIESCYIYIVDMSTGGMMVMTDFPLPEKDSFAIKILLEDPMEFAVRLVWQKQIMSQMNVTGLQFTDTTEETARNACTFIDRFSLETTKKTVRLNKMMPSQIRKDDEWVNFYLYIMSLGIRGFEFTTDFELPVDQPFTLRIFLEPRKNPIETEARVLFRKEISMERKKGWLEFLSLSEQNRLRIKEHIARLIQGDLPCKTAVKLEGFSVDSNDSDTGETADTEDHGLDEVNKLYSETEEAINPDDRDWMP
jgi:hypothetical protein